MPYDEFGLFHENAEEFGIAWRGDPAVRRVAVDVGAGQRDQRARVGRRRRPSSSCSTAARRTRTPGTPSRSRSTVRSSRSTSRATATRRTATTTRTGRRENAVAVETAVRELAPDADVVVGMSLGGLTSIALTDRAPDLVRALVLVDVTPGVNREKASRDRAVHRRTRVLRVLRRDPRAHGRVQPDAVRVVAAARHPAQRGRGRRRSVALALRPAAARERRRRRRAASCPGIDDAVGRGRERIEVPLTLARGALSPVVDDDDVAELLRRKPDAQVVVFEGAGHSIQGDKPVELAALPRGSVGSTGRPQPARATPGSRRSCRWPGAGPRSCRRAAARLETVALVAAERRSRRRGRSPAGIRDALVGSSRHSMWFSEMIVGARDRAVGLALLADAHVDEQRARAAGGLRLRWP